METEIKSHFVKLVELHKFEIIKPNNNKTFINVISQILHCSNLVYLTLNFETIS